MGEYVNQMLAKSMPALLAGDVSRVEEISAIDDKVDQLYADIVAYLGKVSRMQLMDTQSQELSNQLSAANDLESIGDIIETDAVALGKRCLEEDIHISEPTQNVLGALHRTIEGAVKQALESVAKNDVATAQDVIAMKGGIQREVELAEQHQSQRLVADAPNRIAAYSVEMEVIEKLKRIYYFAKRMAKTVEADRAPAQAQPA